MSVIDEVRRLKAEGKPEQAIMDTLRQNGVTEREISDAMSQADIKEAVSSSGVGQQVEGQAGQVQEGGVGGQVQGGARQIQETQQPVQGQAGEQEMYEPSPYQGEQGQAPTGQGYEGMEPSMAAGEQVGEYQDYGASRGYGEVGGGYGGGGYPEYQQYQEGMSSDVITEIAEQVVGEKMAQMRESLERTLDFRTVAEAKIEGLNERLRRMEKIIDKLQLSILEKVGEYLGDAKSLKKELLETQKSFKAVSKKK